MNLDIPGFHSEHLFGNKSTDTNKGRTSGGISLYYKHSLECKLEVVERLQCGIMWIKLSRDLFDFNEDVYLCNTYIPPHYSKVNITNEFDILNEIELGIEKYKNKGKLFVTDDFNCRTADAPDFLEFDMYIDDTHQSDLITVTPRVDKDHMLDRKGKQLLELCQATSLIIGNGRLHNDLGIGEYTYHTHNGASVVDYLLLNANDLKLVTEFYITRLNEFSDHCGVAFYLKTILNVNETMNTDNSYECTYVKFDIDKVDEFKNLLSNKMNVINVMLQGVETNTDINSVVQSFTNFMHEVTHDVFLKTKHRPQTHKRRAHKMWFNADCYKAKKRFNKH